MRTLILLLLLATPLRAADMGSAIPVPTPAPVPIPSQPKTEPDVELWLIDGKYIYLPKNSKPPLTLPSTPMCPDGRCPNTPPFR